MQNDIQTLIEPIIPLFAQIESASSSEVIVTAYHALGTQLVQASVNSPTPAMLKNITDALKEIAPAHHAMNINTLRAIYRFAKEYKAEDLVQKKLAFIPWSHHTVLLHTVQDAQARLFYCDAILKYRWSRAALIRNIHSNLYERHARVVTNFSSTLPRSYAQQAHTAFKQSYLFTVADDVTTEREIEDGLMLYITDFLKELGPGFAFVGRQYHIQTIGDDCYIDLLLYHTLLRCYVVIELKNGALKPEYAGKMHFYMQAVDAALKTAHDNQTIGLILCRSTSPATIATLYDTAKPMVVAEYQLKSRVEKQEKKNVPPASPRWRQFLRKFMGYLCITLSFLTINSAWAAENLALVCVGKECADFSYKAVTEPYWPSRIARKKISLPVGLQVGLLLGFYPLLTQTDKLDTRRIASLGNVARATIALLKHAVMAQLKERDFIDLLLAEPHMAFNMISLINTLCWEEIYVTIDKAKGIDYSPDHKGEIAFLKHYLHKYEMICPIFLWGCPYTCRPGHHRFFPACDTFHEKVIAATINQVEKKNDTIHYVTDPIDGLFSDLFILSRALAQKPTASIAIHFLNGKNYEYCVLKDTLQLTRALDTENTIDLSANLKRIEAYITDNKIDYNVEPLLINAEESERFVKPALSFLRKSFPQAHIEFYLYKDHTDYWNYRETHNLPVADIIYTTHEKFMNRLNGLPDSPGHWTYSSFEHELLCLKTLQKNPFAAALFVSYNDLDSNATLACTIRRYSTSKTISLEIPAESSPDLIRSIVFKNPEKEHYYFCFHDPNKKADLFVEIERI